MAGPQDASLADHGDIDINSSLLIRICIRSINQVQPGFSPSEFGISRNQLEGSVWSQDELSRAAPGAERYTGHGHAKATRGDTNLDQVLAMPSQQLELLHTRVQQLELSNYGLLKRIYGAQVPAEPYTQFSGPGSAPLPDHVHESYRYRLYGQYRKMMSTARNPQFLGMDPVTAGGELLLQEYLTQLRMLLSASQAGQQSHQAESDESVDHRPRSRHLRRRHSAKIDKKSTQTYKARLDSWNATVRPPVHQSAALTDYQSQLKVLEEQNQQRLSIMTTQQQFQQPRLFDWVQYDSSFAAMQAADDEKWPTQNLSPTSLTLPMLSESPVSDSDQQSSLASPVDVAQGSPIDGSTIEEALRGRSRKVKLPTRERRKPLKPRT